MTKCPSHGTELLDIPDDVGIDPSRYEVHAAGKTLRLTPRQFQLFSMLYLKLGVTIPNETLIGRLHKLKLHHAPPSQDTMRVWICILRKKTRPLGFRIETRRGLGVALLREPTMAVTAEQVLHRKLDSSQASPRSPTAAEAVAKAAQREIVARSGTDSPTGKS